MHSILRNLFPAEGTLAGSPVAITFPWSSRQVVVTNDSTINTMTVTIGPNSLSLKPTETLTANIQLSSVTINGTGAYRVWAFG